MNKDEFPIYFGDLNKDCQKELLDKRVKFTGKEVEDNIETNQ